MSQVVTLTFYRYQGLERWWGMSRTRLLKNPIHQIEGVQFMKFMGSGGYGGFSIRPDFSTYALLIAWKNESLARQHLFNNVHFNILNEKATECWHLILSPIHAKGKWSGTQPFVPVKPSGAKEQVAIITRASIRIKQLIKFWKFVPGVSKDLYKQPGLIFSKGIGEIPLLEQATFSIWNSRQLMENFAYHGQKHREVIARTRKLGWYREELFARFEIKESIGTYRGKNPLSENERYD